MCQQVEYPKLKLTRCQNENQVDDIEGLNQKNPTKITSDVSDKNDGCAVKPVNGKLKLKTVSHNNSKKRKMTTTDKGGKKQKMTFVGSKLTHEEYRGPTEFLFEGFSIISAETFEELQLGVSPVRTIEMESVRKTSFDVNKVCSIIFLSFKLIFILYKLIKFYFILKCDFI